MATECSKFIDAHKDQPFLVYYSCYSVHTPLMARPDLQRKYEARRAALLVTDLMGGEPPRRVRLSQDHAVYAAMVEAMDQAVGKVLAKLAELNLSDNTLVIFTSDNGGLSTSEGSPTSNHPLRAGKGWLYEGGIRTAGLVRWPGVIPAGVTNDTPVISPDYLPTILEAVGITTSPGQKFDGVSMLPILTARSPAFQKSRASDAAATGPERPLFWHYPHYGNQGSSPGAAVAIGDWKLIEWFEENRIELFNLSTDPDEKMNLSASEPQRVSEMLDTLHTWQKDVGAKFSTPNSAYDPAKLSGRN